MFENINIKPLVRNAKRLTSFVHTNKLGTDQYLILTKAQHENSIRLQLSVNNVLVITSYPFEFLTSLDEKTVLNNIKNLIATNYIVTCINEGDSLREGINALIKNDPKHPFSQIFMNINKGEIVDTSDENVQYILSDLINEVYA